MENAFTAHIRSAEMNVLIPAGLL